MSERGLHRDCPDHAWLSLPSPAKLNRMLHITGRRTDGYHELQTLFQFLDIGDTLHLRLRDDGQLSLASDIAGVAMEDNLALRAARLLQHETGATLGADIRLDKRLPMGGGLGGGSSNAATVLLALNRLWQLGLDEQQLAELGLRLGADVPVFVRGRAAWAEGVGERLTPVTLDTPWFVVLHPGMKVATAAVFQAPQLTRDTPPISMARALQGDAPAWRNDCEATVCVLYPRVAHALDRLSRLAPTMLTGTGACLFAQVDSEAQADEILSQLAQEWQAFKARGCNISPLHVALGCGG
ncbi:MULTISPECIES: 4-(cytidine 5'-diphospho)-2-C-methyl-D-erythritol kinase [Halomonadaceae]|uniref:4-(cytidine 5'-diphospho)-2-C-methyl-D-erythritol kinase n=1 Tax=Halomonadaceae TaxID=28256 RepID=UPI00159AE699|nr:MULTISPECIES: 4-(cytidine 5'-diphospho)-2-C-methyl-D-erythritol kinase [Halomonas]QJQ96473.1 4-(cytidine 5'-diphospho)-2-C-methyl-D-erythritol kinase [Halomonas sp. PA5]